LKKVFALRYQKNHRRHKTGVLLLPNAEVLVGMGGGSDVEHPVFCLLNARIENLDYKSLSHMRQRFVNPLRRRVLLKSLKRLDVCFQHDLRLNFFRSVLAGRGIRLVSARAGQYYAMVAQSDQTEPKVV
jgi:hypothetical protein